jgi:hypothetical protein
VLVGLGRSVGDVAVDLLLRLAHVQHAPQQVDVRPPQPRELARAQARVRGRQDQRPVVRRDRAGQGAHLVRRQEQHLVGRGPREADVQARVHAQQP